MAMAKAPTGSRSLRGKKIAGGRLDESSGSGPIIKTGRGIGHTSIPREGYYPKATDHRGDTQRDSYGGVRSRHGVDRKVGKKPVV